MHPRAASPLVAYLLSEDAGWLSGQVFRVEGGSVIKMRGWEKGSERLTSTTGGYLVADELVAGMRHAFGTLPSGMASLQ